MQRNGLQRSLRSIYQDSEWGFGQITVVLLWGPFFNDDFLEIISEGEFLSIVLLNVAKKV
jgi:hypothetical protein